MSAIPDQIITASVREFGNLTGLGHTKIYELITNGSLDSIKVGKRRLVIMDSYRKLVESLRGAS